MVNKGEQMGLLMDAIRVTQKWYSTPGAVDVSFRYAQVLLEVFPQYFPDNTKWVLMKRSQPECPYELRCEVGIGNFYVVALVPADMIGFIRDVFGPNYADKAVPRE